MRKFKALETIEGMITKGNVYQESRQYTGFQSCIHVIGDDGFEKTLFEERFEEMLEPITFASQEEFENAVMEVVIKRLNVCDYSKGGRIYFDVEDAFKEIK